MCILQTGPDQQVGTGFLYKNGYSQEDNMKKYLALAMALVMCLALFSGCGQENGSTESAAPAESTV